MGIEIAVRKSYGSYELDFQLKSDARRIAILGESGSGKSLTLKSIAGVEVPDSGRIVVDGRVLYDSDGKVCVAPRDRRVGYLFQNYALFPTMTVEENIGIGIRDKKVRKDIVRSYIEKYSLQGLEKQYPMSLSGGQQQRVALARMMAGNPEVILLDEPFSALDHHLREEMIKQLKHYLADFAGTVILVSHDRDEVYRLSEELVIQQAGSSITHGKTRELFERPGTVETALLTGCRNIGRLAEGQQCFVEEWNLQLPVVARKPGSSHIGIRAHHIRSDRPKGEPYFAIPVYQCNVSEGLWECTVSIKTTPQSKEELCLKLPKAQWKELEKVNLKEVYLRERDLLFLEK